jgi:hypothetical protein
MPIVEPRDDEDGQTSLLRQAHDRARRVAEDLSRYRLELERPFRAVPGPVLAEGKQKVRSAADAATALRDCLGTVLREPGPSPTSTPTNQGST